MFTPEEQARRDVKTGNSAVSKKALRANMEQQAPSQVRTTLLLIRGTLKLEKRLRLKCTYRRVVF